MFYMIPNKRNLSLFKENLILPLKGYSIGFDEYFDSEEIEEISKTREVNVIINKFLHKGEINSIKEVIERMPSVKYFFVEDLGLTNIIDKNRIVLFQNHIINNYDSVNYFKELGINNIVVSNELTKEELKEIREKTNSNLFYFLINKNMLMYSKRPLITSYYEHKNINGEYKKVIEERVSKKELIIKEEESGTTIYNSKIFSFNKYMNSIGNLNYIINFSNLNEEETNIILENYNKENLSDYLEIDDYFVNNKIIYKVGE